MSSATGEFRKYFQSLVDGGHDPNEAAAIALRKFGGAMCRDTGAAARAASGGTIKAASAVATSEETREKRRKIESNGEESTKMCVDMQDKEEDENSDDDNDDDVSDEMDASYTLFNLERLKNQIAVARNLAGQKVLPEEECYQTLIDTIEYVFGGDEDEPYYFKTAFIVCEDSKAAESRRCPKLPTRARSFLRTDEAVEAYRLLTSKASVPDLVRSTLFKSLESNIRRLRKQTTPRASGDVKLETLRPFVTLSLATPLIFAAPEHHESLLIPFCEAVATLSPFHAATLVGWWSQLSKDIFSDLVLSLQQYITVALYSRMVGPFLELHKRVKVVGALMKLLFAANDAVASRTGKPLVPASTFYNSAVNSEINFRQDTRRWASGKPSFLEFPFLVDAANKADVLHVHSFLEMRRRAHDTFMRMIMSNSAGGQMPYNVVRVRRSNVVDDSLRELQQKSDDDLKKPLKVKFEGEEGVDEGGVQKEYFQVIMRQLIDPKYGMFVENKKSRLLWINGRSFESPMRFELIGKLIGIAIYNSVIVDLHLPTVFYGKLLGRRPTLGDLEELDPDAHRGLRQLLDLEPKDVADAMLTFEISEESFGAVHSVELKKGGADIEVTAENRREYVDLYVKRYLETGVARQFDALRRGFLKACGGKVLDMFRADELELLICGKPELDFRALERSTRYDEGYNANSSVIKHFWSVVHAMSIERQRMLLAFCTGCDRAPIKGLGALKFVIGRVADASRLPSAHTCFNHLLLPEYKTRADLKNALYRAIEQSEGFGLM